MAGAVEWEQECGGMEDEKRGGRRGEGRVGEVITSGD